MGSLRIYSNQSLVKWGRFLFKYRDYQQYEMYVQPKMVDKYPHHDHQCLS